MNLVFFTHPSFLNQQSMPRFTQMLAEGMKRRGHQVEIWQPKAQVSRLQMPTFIRKWAGYIDQYILFPREVKSRLKKCPPNTLFIFTDQALGPWVPLVSGHPCVIHCHDFLAQRSALGEIPENPTRLSGRIYQAYIRRGYSQGQNFISVSHKTREDLHSFLSFQPTRSEVIYNGLNQAFAPHNLEEMRVLLKNKTSIKLEQGYILHVGGNEWYKNRLGVIELYNTFRTNYEVNLPLLMIGKKPTSPLLDHYTKSPFKSDIHFLSNIDDQFLRIAYAGASLFLFPSLAEGFGWPIAEAMASGCPVITTNRPPMSEVGGKAAFYIEPQPFNGLEITDWASESAKVIKMVLDMNPSQRQKVINTGSLNSQRFNPENILDKIEYIYQQVC